MNSFKRHYFQSCCYINKSTLSDNQIWEFKKAVIYYILYLLVSPPTASAALCLYSRWETIVEKSHFPCITSCRYTWRASINVHIKHENGEKIGCQWIWSRPACWRLIDYYVYYRDCRSRELQFCGWKCPCWWGRSEANVQTGWSWQKVYSNSNTLNNSAKQKSISEYTEFCSLMQMGYNVRSRNGCKISKIEWLKIGKILPSLFLIFSPILIYDMAISWNSWSLYARVYI